MTLWESFIETTPLAGDPWLQLGVTTGVAILAGAVRCVPGWLTNSLKDGKIDAFEWKQLWATMIEYFSYIFIFSFAMPVDAAVGTTLGIDLARKVVRDLKAKQ